MFLGGKLMNYLAVACILGIVILFHELGHFLAAGLVKLPIRIFSIGFGPKLWSFTRNGTEYRLALIPFGGYVLPDFYSEEEYFAIAPGRRLVMAAGGPAASIILTVLCLATLNLFSADVSLYNLLVKPVIQTVTLFGKMTAALPTVFSKTGQISGVIGLITQGGELLAADYLRVWWFTGLVSLNLALLNLLPVPALDGGKMLLCLLERIHPRFLRLQYSLTLAGWVLLLGLMVYTTVVDVGRLI
jgi:membrane-associated protease RseP (regulator of RpoE activity)